MYTIERTVAVYTVQRTLYSEVYTIKCTLYNVYKCTLYTVNGSALISINGRLLKYIAVQQCSDKYQLCTLFLMTIIEAVNS